MYSRVEAAKIRKETKAKQDAEHALIRAQVPTKLEGRYDVLVADPPWPLKMMRKDVSPTHVGWKYPTMPVEAITQTLSDLTRDHARADSHMFLWTTHRMLPKAFDVLESSGWTYSCCFVWHKGNGVQPFRLPKFNCEFILYGRQGRPSFSSQKGFPTCFWGPSGAHSVKPDFFYSMIARVTEGQRRVDLFGRRAISGFDSWGLEAPVASQ